MIAPVQGSIVDLSGNPFPTNGKPQRPRLELSKAYSDAQKPARAQRPIAARYDAAGDGDEYKNIWAAADSFDADSAHSPHVRGKLVRNSRYEIANNGFADGIASTYANDLVGLGPSLRMQTGSEGFNRLVELSWWMWCREIKFRRKLWCMAHAKHSDGEGIAVIRQNRKLRHGVKLDLVLHETEQMASPWLSYGEKNHIDGIKFDEFGNPEYYEFLRSHPGSTNDVSFAAESERIAARYVMHWYQMRRPGQHRGVPEMASTLNLGAAARRWREAVVAAAENIADFSLFIKTQAMPDDLDAVEPMSTLDIQKRMMTALPAGYDAFQPKAEQPTSTYAEFSKALINEQARPKSMPYNKAACDSSSYNYASGRLDHSTYYGSLDVDRQDCNDIVLDPLFDVWFDFAIVTFGWLGGNPEAVSDAAKFHEWDWPKHQVADIKSEASANETRLKNGSTSLAAIYTSAGEDHEDALIDQASECGVTVDQMRTINLIRNLPQHAVQPVCAMLGIAAEPSSSGQATTPSEDDDEQED